MSGKMYLETFDSGPRGWCGYERHTVMRALEHKKGTVTARSPFMLDSNHAPPGGGYFQIIAFLMTGLVAQTEAMVEPLAGKNAFLAGGYPNDFTNARITVRLRGEGDMKGAKLVVLVQRDTEDRNIPALLTAQPMKISERWSEHTVTLSPDESLWLMLGASWNKTHLYKRGPISRALRRVKNIIFVLYPLDVVPLGQVEARPELITFANPEMAPKDLEARYILRAGRDYHLDSSRLPSGCISFDTVKIEYPE
ncbi:MAG: hypothetical protein FJ319_01245 [SAR202 cluster bacterium]|nr:hypothetical protein [SAR202 cluster bacterium]